MVWVGGGVNGGGGMVVWWWCWVLDGYRWSSSPLSPVQHEAPQREVPLLFQQILTILTILLSTINITNIKYYQY